jgi:RNA polymerase sigma-70 factor, ECF subfamily
MTDPPVISNSGSPLSTSATLLERARARDRAAWERLVDLYEPLILYWCRQSEIGPADSADIKQEVFLAVAGHIGAFRLEEPGHTFRGWLRAITRNKIRDHLGRAPPNYAQTGGSDAYRDLLNVEAADPPGGSEAELAGELGVLYRRALELIVTEFEEVTWKAFWRVVVDGQPPGGVARDLAISRNAVYLAKARVLQRLRDEFKDLIQ